MRPLKRSCHAAKEGVGRVRTDGELDERLVGILSNVMTEGRKSSKANNQMIRQRCSEGRGGTRSVKYGPIALSRT